MASRFGAFLLLVLLPLAAPAAPPAISLTEIASGLTAPVEIAITGPGSSRLYVAEQGGRIRIVENGQVLANDFLDVSALLAAGGERGLLGLAFHPEYAANGAFYVFYTRAADGALTLTRYLRDAIDPDTADPASGAVVLEIAHPVNANHNGGRLAFGPDGHLYIGTGDGGGIGDPNRHAQNPGNLLGKILRVAVDGGTGYTIPAANPFAGSSCSDDAGQCPEILHYGLRNPWKFSFDRENGDLYVGDGEIYIADRSNGKIWRIDAAEPPFRAASDFSGDGKADVFWRNPTSGQNYLWIMNGLAIASQGYMPSVAGPDWEVVGVADYNGDTRADVLWRNKTTGQNYLWAMNGLVVSSQGDLPSVADANWRVVGFGDYNSDGKGDVLWRHATSGQNYLWTLNGINMATQGYLPSVAGTNWQPVKR